MLRRIEARGFRNLTSHPWELESGSHLLLGNNGAGKTSWLEAVYVLATTRSFRAPRIADCRRHGSDGFTLKGEVESLARASLSIGWWEGRRRREVNGSKTSLADHLAQLSVVAWSASDLEVLQGNPSVRRRFLDRGVVGRRPATLSILSRYRQALAAKRELLKQEGRGLETWNGVLAEAAAELTRERASYVRDLEEALQTVLSDCDLGIPPVRLRYRPSPSSALEGGSAIAAALFEARSKERRLRRPLLGPQRDELEILWGGHELRRVASAGERKAFGLALTAAQGHVLSMAGRPPLYLVDDADVELDQGRLTAVWRGFSGARQILASSNRPEIWEGIEIDRRWHCREGLLEPR